MLATSHCLDSRGFRGDHGWRGPSRVPNPSFVFATRFWSRPSRERVVVLCPALGSPDSYCRCTYRVLRIRPFSSHSSLGGWSDRKVCNWNICLFRSVETNERDDRYRNRRRDICSPLRCIPCRTVRLRTRQASSDGDGNVLADSSRTPDLVALPDHREMPLEA